MSTNQRVTSDSARNRKFKRCSNWQTHDLYRENMHFPGELQLTWKSLLIYSAEAHLNCCMRGLYKPILEWISISQWGNGNEISIIYWCRARTYNRVRPLMLDNDSGQGPLRLLLFKRLLRANNGIQQLGSNHPIFHHSYRKDFSYLDMQK